MSTIRVADRDRWVSISNAAIDDERLSFRARGVLAWLLSKPNGWSINSNSIAASGSEGRDAIRTALGELENHGYLVREKIRNNNGTIATISTLYEVPPGPRNPASDEPASDNPAPEESTKEKELPLSVVPNGDDYSAAFLEAWEAYPRKIEKKAAWRAWKATVKRCGREARADMIAAAKNYAIEVHGSEDRHIKHGSSFYGPDEPWRDRVAGPMVGGVTKPATDAGRTDGHMTRKSWL